MSDCKLPQNPRHLALEEILRNKTFVYLKSLALQVEWLKYPTNKNLNLQPINKKQLAMPSYKLT